MNLEVGRIYEVRNPKEALDDFKAPYIKITKKTSELLKPFVGHNGNRYTESGLYESNVKISAYDLVREIDTTKANPLNVDYIGFESSIHRLGDLRSSFQHDIVVNYKFQIAYYESPLLEDSVEMIVNYAIDLMIDYKNKNAGVLPGVIVFSIIDQVKDVVKNTFSFIDDSPFILDDIEKWVKEKICFADIEDYIVYYFKYFIDIENKNKRSKNVIATVLKLLIQSYLPSWAVVSEKDISTKIRQTYGFTPSLSDYNEAEKAINSIFGLHRKIITRYGMKLAPDSEMLVSFTTEIPQRELIEIGLKFQKIL